MSEQKTIPITIFQAPYASLMERGLYLKMHDYDHPFCGTVPAEYYLPSFKGEIECPQQLPDDREQRTRTILEQVYTIFNTAHPTGYCGRSLSVGDVVKLENAYYSIFGSCLDGTDPCLRLEGLMAAECGGKDGWVVEDCGIVSYLLIECSDCTIPTTELFYSYDGALDRMLSRLAETGELDAEQMKKDFAATKELFEEDCYRVSRDSAWLADPCADWRWSIQPVCVYGPTKIVFPEQENGSCPE